MFKHRYLSAAVLALAVSAATPACAAGLYYQRPIPGQRVADRAFDRGSRDGFDVGRDDARHHRRPEPERASRFRSANHDYDRHYGPRDQYQRVYRDGFREGYERGFREYRR
jgi:hypothetical protein